MTDDREGCKYMTYIFKCPYIFPHDAIQSVLITEVKGIRSCQPHV